MRNFGPLLILAVAVVCGTATRTDEHGASVVRDGERLYLLFETSKGERYIESGFDAATKQCTSWYGREMVQQMSQHVVAAKSRPPVLAGRSRLLMLGLGGGMLIAQLLCQQQQVVDSVLAVELSKTIVETWWRDFYPATVEPCLIDEAGLQQGCIGNNSNMNKTCSSHEVPLTIVEANAIKFIDELSANRTAAAKGVENGCFRFVVVDCFAMVTGNVDDKLGRPVEPPYGPEFLSQLRSLLCTDDSLLLINTTPTDYDMETVPLVSKISRLFNDVRVRRKRKQLLSGYNVVISASNSPSN